MKPEPRFKIKPITTNSLESTPQRDISRIPTKPEGGLLPGRKPQLTVEENSARLARNSVAPLLFGESFGGVTMAMTRDEMKAVLTDASFSTDSGLDVFDEGFYITWGEGLNPLPKSVQMNENYKGAIKLPAPYGDVKLNQPFLDPKTLDIHAFTNTLGQAFSGKDAAYKCVELKECQYEVRDSGEILIDYPKGTLVLDGTSIFLLEYLPNQGFASVSKAPVLGEDTIVGLHSTMKRADVEKLLGLPYRYARGGAQLYDGKTVAIKYRANGDLDEVAVTEGYAGTLTFAGTERAMGTSFAEVLADKEVKDRTDELFMHTFIRTLLGVDESFDCLKQEGGAICAFRNNAEAKLLRVQLGPYIFDFTNDEQKLLKKIVMFNTAAE